MKSLETRLAGLEKRAEYQTTPPLEVQAGIMLVTTREEVAAFRALPPVAPPRGSGPVRLSAREVDFAEYLRERGVPPQLHE